jgi:EmrB/QacA subfamily drug resistance transporter
MPDFSDAAPAAELHWPRYYARRIERQGGPTDRDRWLVAWTVLLGAVWVTSTITILAVSRPLIAADLGTSAESLVWLISGPTIAIALTGTTAGKVGDLHGHRRVYLFGMLGATLFVMLSAVAWSGPSLIAFRVLGATIGSATIPSSLAVINRLFGPSERSRPLGFWSLVVAAGPVIGLVVGGPLVEHMGWRAMFWAQAPLLGLSAVLALLVLPDTPKQRNVHFDVLGQVALFVMLAALLAGIDRAAALGIDAPLVLGLFAAVPLALWWFVRVERRAEHPLIPLAWFRKPSFALAVAIGFFIQFGYMGGFTLTPKLLAEVSGMGADQIALLMVPRPLTFAIAGPVAGMLAHRVSARATVVFGTTMLVGSLAVFAATAADPKVAMVVVALMLSGVGIGATQPRLTATVADAVPAADLGVAGATQLLVAQIGTTIGMNLLEAVQSTERGSLGLGGSYQAAYALGAVVSAVGVVLALRLRDPKDPALHRHDHDPDRNHDRDRPEQAVQHHLLAVGDDGHPVAAVDMEAD